MSRDRYADSKACEPHVRWIYCQSCNDYSEVAGVTCHGDHLGDAACATVARCLRCQEDEELVVVNTPTEVPVPHAGPKPGACESCGAVFFHSPLCPTPEERAPGADEDDDAWVVGADFR